MVGARSQEVSGDDSSLSRGLIVLGLLSLVDLAAPLFTDGQHPPMVIALIGAGLGLISIILVILAWRGRLAAAITLVCCGSCRLGAVPAFLSRVATGLMITSVAALDSP